MRNKVPNTAIAALEAFEVRALGAVRGSIAFSCPQVAHLGDSPQHDS